VRSCPAWDMADLVGHVGGAWARGAAVLRTGAEAQRPEVPVVGSDDELLDWARKQAAEVADAVATLGVADPDHDCWTFGMPRSRRFWVRRMALETALHAWDAVGAVGRSLPIDSDLAADGVDEFLTVILPRSLGRNPGTWSGQSLHLHRTDGDGEWLVRLDAGQAAVERGHAKGDVAVRGGGSDLYLWCTGRGKVDELPGLDVVGDRSVAERWSTDVAF
jgi:uncharacterized protein (TIGR03083 family)